MGIATKWISLLAMSMPALKLFFPLCGIIARVTICADKISERHNSHGSREPRESSAQNARSIVASPCLELPTRRQPVCHGRARGFSKQYVRSCEERRSFLHENLLKAGANSVSSPMYP